MEDQEEDSSVNTPLPGWTFVDSKGEVVVQTGSDSETSESSIEVVSVEGNEVVSFHQGRKEKTGDAESGDKETRVAETEKSNTTTLEGEQLLSSQAISSESGIKYPSSFQAVADFVPCVEQNLAENLSGKGNCNHEQIAGPTDLDTCLGLPSESGEKDDGAENSVPKNKSIGWEESESSSNMDMTECLQGACCKELLQVYDRNNFDDNSMKETSASTSFDAKMRNLEQDKEEEETHSLSGDNRSETSSDSDFVRLDQGVLEDLRIMNHEGDMAPMPMNGSHPSIDENFRFMRAQDAEAPIVHLPPMLNNQADDNDGFEGDIDRDDETESSTEDGFDDRIESEQSEAGSNMMMNDVGDLSAFADIGDIPLVVGDVRRNYIHRPNNRLSSLLNISLLLAAILTTGISLGIIMATDLEIEEWQNAYELQTLRVRQLESQLQEKRSQLDMQESEFCQLKDLSNRLKLKLVGGHRMPIDQKAKKAFDWFEAHGVVEGRDFSHASHLVEGAIQLFIHCEEELKSDDTGNDNESIIQETVCKEELEEFIMRLKGSGGMKSRYFTEVNSNVKETQYHGSGLDLGKAARNHVPDSIDGSDVPKKGQSVVEIDIRRLQKSLSIEQERALHWQHLYLFERRERERERENEEWEDERDREEWEREWKMEREAMKKSGAESSELECLKKILASNFTTLTQHVANLNVSVFDDFANLSILLSSVQDLKQSVVNSLNKVWDGAEEVLGRFESGENENTKPFWAKAESLRQYFLEVVQLIQHNSKPQLLKLLSNLQYNLESMKKGLETMKDEVSSEKVAFWLEHIWSITHGITEKLKTNVRTLVPEKEILLTYIGNLLDSLEMKDAAKMDVKPRDVETYDAQLSQEQTESFSKPYSSYDDDENEDKDEDEEEEEKDEENFAEKETIAQDNLGWSACIHNILGNTKRSFVHLGKKVSRTFDEIKSIWHKKDMPLLRIAKRLTSKFIRASAKFTKMCTKLPASLFKRNKESKDESQIHVDSKQVKKIRKQWQKQLFKNPCEEAGFMSIECNLDTNTLKKQLKEVSKLFSHLLRIKIFQPHEAIDMSKEEAMLHYELFRSFLERWGERSMLLKIDLEWAVCQRDWWAQVVNSKLNGNVEKVAENKCNIITSDESLLPIGSVKKIGTPKIKKASSNIKRKKNGDRKDDENRGKNVPKYKPLNRREKQVNISDPDEVTGDNYSSNSQYPPREEKRSMKNEDEDMDQRNYDWLLKKAQHRANQRKQHSKADWLFERSRYRRLKAWKGQNHGKTYKESSEEENWALKHGRYRQQQWKDDHRADWVFDRAADRKEQHSALLGCEYPKHGYRKQHNSKDFRCVYGKASMP